MDFALELEHDVLAQLPDSRNIEPPTESGNAYAHTIDRSQNGLRSW